MSETEKNRAKPVALDDAALDDVAGGLGQTTSGNTTIWPPDVIEKAGAAGKAGKVTQKVIK